MEIAKDIQMGLLPSALPQLNDVAFAGLCVPAHEVGGDYYDLIRRDEQNYDLIIADVSGHNIGSALIMAEARTFIHARIDNILQPADMLTALNSYFLKDLDRSDLFVTMFYLQYNRTSRQLTYSNAGHNNPLIWRNQSKTIEFIDAEGLIFGIRDNIAFEQKTTRLAEGDMLLLYTDGIIEAENNNKDFSAPKDWENCLKNAPNSARRISLTGS